METAGGSRVFAESAACRIRRNGDIAQASSARTANGTGAAPDGLTHSSACAKFACELFATLRRCRVTSSLNDSVGWLLNNAARLSARRLSTKLAGHNVTPPQWGVLVALWEQDGLSLSELAKRSFFDGPTMTGIVDRLEKGGLVERRRDSTDRRVISVYLTLEGRELQSRLPALSEEANQDAVAGIPPEEVERFLDTLRKVIANLS